MSIDIPLPGTRHATVFGDIDIENRHGAIGLVYSHAEFRSFTSRAYLLRFLPNPRLDVFDRSFSVNVSAHTGRER